MRTAWQWDEAKSTWTIGTYADLFVTVRYDGNGWFVSCPEVQLDPRALTVTSINAAKRQALATVLRIAQKRCQLAGLLVAAHKRTEGTVG